MFKLIILAGLVIAFIVSLFFEESREFYSTIFEFIGEGLSSIWELITSGFENITEVSVYGLAFAVLGTTLIFFTREWMITPFVQYYNPPERIFWTVATYITVFLGGYFLGKAFENTA
jgi:hypothetical protein